MHIYKKIVPSYVVALALLFPSLCLAGGDSGRQVIKQVFVNSSGIVRLFGATGLWSNPDACDSAASIVFLPTPEGNVNEYYSEGYALIVGSYLQGKQVSGYLKGCQYINGPNMTYPVVQTINSYE